MLRMPLYFILSGLFYKDYGGLINLSIRKFDKLIIPFIFFVILTIISTNIIGLILPAFSVVEFNDLSFNRPIPTPVWFLLCLFWDNLIFWLIRKLSQSKAVQFILILMTSIIGVILITHEIFLPLHLTSSIMSMPFFFAGTVIRTIPTLNNGNNSKKRDVTIFLLLTILVMIFAYSLNWPDINMYMCSATLTETLAYIPLSIIMVIGFLHLCKVVKSIPVVSYMGRYSIIILGIHPWAHDKYNERALQHRQPVAGCICYACNLFIGNPVMPSYCTAFYSSERSTDSIYKSHKEFHRTHWIKRSFQSYKHRIS